MSCLYLDFETSSEVDLEEVGVWNYSKHPSTEILLMAYAIDNEDVVVIEDADDLVLPDLKDAKIVCWNSTFERLIMRHVLGLDVPITRFIDPMIQARYLSMPGKLERVCDILKLPPNLAKRDGDKLIDLFCRPAHMGGEETLFGISKPRYNNKESHPREWEEFKEYVKQDVVAERAIFEMLSAHPLPQSEIDGYSLDQKINDRGMPVDMELVQKMDKIAIRAKDEAWKTIKNIAKIENPNSNPQILAWAQTQGYPYGSLEKKFVTAALESLDITSDCATVLETRKNSAKTSDSKLQTLKTAVSPDGFVRDQFSFMGAPRTARWSGHGVQLHNLPRATKEVEKKIDRAVELLLAEDYDKLKVEFSSVLDTIAGCIRPCFKAPEGKQLVICDLNAIENRLLGYITGCQKITDVFIRGEDPYVKFAEVLYGIPYTTMVDIIDGKHICKSEYKDYRQNAKPAVLGAGYMLSAGEEKENKDGDIIKTGLWGYAAQLGIDLPLDLCKKAVRIFREEYEEVCEFWYNCEDAAEAAVTQKRKIKLGFVTFDMHGQTLRIQLPSGRYLHYIRPEYRKTEFRGKQKNTLFFEGLNGKTKIWEKQSTYGGRLTENIIQATARDVLLNGMMNADRMNLCLVGHVHDELIALEDIKRTTALEELREAMSKSPSWAPKLCLGADGFISERYKKG